MSKLGNYKHFSVFSHSFAYKKVGELNALKIAATKFKSHYNPKYPDVIGVSLRHYLEELLEIDPQQYLKAFEKIAEFDVPINPLGTVENVSLIGLITEYDGYAVFFYRQRKQNSNPSVSQTYSSKLFSKKSKVCKGRRKLLYHSPISKRER